MPSQLQIAQDVITGVALIKDAASAEKISAKFIKVGSFLPRWDVSHPYQWTNGGGAFDMQSYLHEYLQQYSLDYTINGNSQIQVIAWP